MTQTACGARMQAASLAERLCSPCPSSDLSVNYELRLGVQARRIDAEIATLVYGEPELSGPPEGPRRLVWWHKGLGREVAPEFTMSLDAALPDERIRLINLREDGRWWVEAQDARGDYHRADATTEALARRAAALRAWAAMR